MLRPAYGFCYAPVTYLMQYAFTFTLRPVNSRRPHIYAYSQYPIAAARGTGQTDRRTDKNRPSFHNDPSLWKLSIIVYGTKDVEVGVR